MFKEIMKDISYEMCKCAFIVLLAVALGKAIERNLNKK